MRLSVCALTAWLVACLPAFGQVTYDVVYVACPHTALSQARWPDVFTPTNVDVGCNLMLRHQDGSKETLVTGGDGSITDPAVSLDGKWVYYAQFPNVQPDQINTQRGPLPFLGSDIWKINVQTRQKIQLTHQEYTPNTWVPEGWIKPGEPWDFAKMALGYGIFNLGPWPLSGGKVAFVSNRNGFTPTKGYTTITEQLYIMDEDGQNVHAVGPLTLGSALHPFQLLDGRICFSSEEGQGLRDGKHWGYWCMWPDGRQWGPSVSAFMRGLAFHFATQLANGNFVAENYYNLNNWGFGALWQWPIRPPVNTPSFGPIDLEANPVIAATCSSVCVGGVQMSFTPFGASSLTPFTHGQDEAAPVGTNGQRVGKVTQPSAAPGNDLLLVWSPGPVNKLDRPVAGEPLSGIYVVRNNAPVTNPFTQLVKVEDDPAINEMWPRALVPYQQIYGVPEPAVLSWLPNDGSQHPSLPAGTPYGLVGTSSVYKRDSRPGTATDLGYGKLEPANATGEPSSNWIWQGADVGQYANAEIYAMRIVYMEPTSHLSYGPNSNRHWFNNANERLRIAGEIPLRKTDSGGNPILDPDGNPDTSFLAKIQADVPFGFQLIDRDGLTLAVSQTWHQVRPGEIRADCGGCHAHSQLPTDFTLTRAGQTGYVPTDLTNGAIVLTANGATKTLPTKVLDVEYLRDVRPILDAKCLSCHNTSQNAGQLDLSDKTLTTINAFDYRVPGYMATNQWPNDYVRLEVDIPAQYGRKPMANQWIHGSRYVNPFQARRSLLMWVLLGRRLDGWTNADHPTETVPGDRTTYPAGQPTNIADVDYTTTLHNAHTAVRSLLTADEILTIGRWIDLGASIDLSGFDGHPGYGYFADETRPTLTIQTPRPNANPAFSEIRIGLADYYSGLKPGSLTVTSDTTLGGQSPGTDLARLPGVTTVDGVVRIPLDPPVTAVTAAHLTARVSDQYLAGNVTEQTIRFSVSGGVPPPPALTLTCPANPPPVTAAGGNPSPLTPVTFPDATPAGGVPPYSPAPYTTPSSGSAFPIGTTTVQGKVTDAIGQQATCSFVVTVVAPTPMLATPTNPNPKNGSTVSTTPNAFTWGSVSGATFYEVIFGDVLSAPAEQAQRLQRNRFPVANLKAASVYQWQVRACNGLGCGGWASWSVKTN